MSEEQKKVKLVILDIDGTLKKEFPPMGLMLLQALAEQGLFAYTALEALSNLDKEYAERRMSRDEMSQAWISTFLKAVEGKKAEAFAEVAADLWKKVENKHFEFVQSALDKLRAEGFEVIVISASPHEIVYEFCQSIGVDEDHFRGTKIKVGEDKNFVAEPEVLLSLPEHKVLRLREMIKDLFAGREIDWGNSIGMGDSHSDENFMRLVGKPIAVCETGKKTNDFIAMAKEMGWEIVDETNAFETISRVINSGAYHLNRDQMPEDV